MRPFLLLLLSMIPGLATLAQTKADSLYFAKNYPQAGYAYLQQNIAHLKEDADLNSLHSRADWLPFLASLEGISFGTPDPTKAKLITKVETFKPQMIQAFVKLKEYYPQAYFPDITFLIGAFTSAGTTSPEAVMIGLDQAARSPDIPLGELTLWERDNLGDVDKLPNLVAHEMCHANQGGIQYDTTLLCAVLIEGMADFFAELTSGRCPNERLHVWAKGHEQRIWADFKKEMYLNRANNWIANSSQETPDHPADLGYWVGYQICKAYYDKSADKNAAIREMLNFKDSKAFFEKSGLSL